MVVCTYVIYIFFKNISLRINLRHEIEKKKPNLNYAHPKHEKHLLIVNV
jgi:hypothetical protein